MSWGGMSCTALFVYCFLGLPTAGELQEMSDLLSTYADLETGEENLFESAPGRKKQQKDFNEDLDDLPKQYEGKVPSGFKESFVNDIVRNDNKETDRYIDNSPLGKSKWITCINSSRSTAFFASAEKCRKTVDMTVNCSGLNLTAVPPDLPFNMKQLILDNNVISELPDNTFENYTHLQNLSIASNCLRLLHNDSFYGLRHLRTLVLTNNILIYEANTFPLFVFRPLKNLTKLKLNLNNPYYTRPNDNYPDAALSYLKRLTSLYIDGLRNTKFGKGFSNMTNLKDLTLAGFTTSNCRISSLYADMFIHMSHLEYLSLQDCYLQGDQIDVKAFEPLSKLKILSLTHNEDIGIENIHKIFYGLRNATFLRDLYLQLINNRYALGQCLNHDLLTYFPPNVEHLDVQENNIEAVDTYFLDKLPKSLKTLDLSGNRFVLGTYVSGMYKLANLSELRLNGGKYFYNLPTYYPYKSQNPFSEPKPNSSCSIYSDAGVKVTKTKFVLHFPLNLTNIEMNEAGLSYKLSYLLVNSSNNVENITLSGNNFVYLLGPIYGFKKLKFLDLSRSQVRSIFSTFFKNLPTLTYLNLSINLLSRCHRNVKKKYIYEALVNLEVLDLGLNNIDEFTPHILDHLISLKKLFLDYNPLKSFDVNISNMPQLEYLSLRHSRLHRLSVYTMKAIDEHITRGVNLSIDMAFNPILCECSNLDFIRWMTASSAFDPKFESYFCMYSDGSMQFIDDQFENTLMILSHECASHVIIFFSVSSGTTFLIILILIAILHRFRWKLKYMYYAAYLHYWKSSARDPNGKAFSYDVFLCYHEDDESFVLDTLCVELEKRGLKTLVHKRDFVSGKPIVSNIVEAVNCSRKTLVVLTDNMARSKWCQFEVQMATMEAVSYKRPVLIFLLMSDVPCCIMGAELSYCVQNNTYLQYPSPSKRNGHSEMDNFWIKLVSDLKN
uniref:TIR domain-containing protein n=1 Tax=Biomphalaria glabrata TaxID=6526 RepID=A0A2C9JYT1_BIOGL